VILGNASILLRRPDYLPTEVGAGALQDIQVEGERLQRIVENMFVLARVHAGGDLQGVEMEPVMVSRVLPALVARHGERFRDRPLTCDVEPDLPPASAAPVYLELVITNLLSNAEKYSPAGQPIEVAASIDDGEIHVCVRDRGHGINVDEAARVFDAFYRAERLAPTAPGVGIGLTVCKRLVEVQGGRIDVCARQGGGTDVRLWLPVEATAVLEPDTADSMPLAAT
jgi:signal transduction histidine kinase